MTLAMKFEFRSADIAEIHAVLDGLAAGHRARDAAAIARAYAPDARIADLAPPLVRHGLNPGAVQTWLDGWDGPVEITGRDLEVMVDGNLAVVHGLEHTQARRDGATAAWWARVTYVLARGPAGWRITHAHASVPFHMDGSDRAALDLEP